MIVACIHPEWKMQSYEYVPGTVRVTLYVWPDVMICGEFAGLAPEGTLVHTTSCGAPLWLSWSAKVTTVPGATVTLAGEKLSVWSAPTFWGMTMVTAPPAGGAVVDVLVIEDDVVEVDVEVEVATLLVVEELVDVDGAELLDVDDLLVVDACEDVVDADDDMLVLDACEDVVDADDDLDVTAELDVVVVVDDELEYTATRCVADVMETVRIGLADPVSAQ